MDSSIESTISGVYIQCLYQSSLMAPEGSFRTGGVVMAHKKVGVYRKYLAPVPLDSAGKCIPKESWPKKRRFCWVARWFSDGGKRHSRSFSTKRLALSFAVKVQAQLQEARQYCRPRISLQQFITEHAELMKGSIAPGTLTIHLATLELLAGYLAQDQLIADIGPGQIEKFRAGRLRTGIAKGTANRDLKTLKRLFNLAILRGYLPKGCNPCDGIAMLKVGSIRRQVIGPQVFTRIYDHTLDAYWRALLVTIYTTGLRLREAINLTWQDIDFESNQLYVTGKKTAGFVQAWTPKDHQMRMIPLAGQAVNLVAAWQSVAPEGCPYVFMERSRWDYYRQCVNADRWCAGTDLVNNLLRRFRTICRQAGVGIYSFRDMRCSCITNWARQLPIYVVQQLAGHSDMRTTQRYYLLVQAEDLDKARDIQAQLLGPVPKADLIDPNVTCSYRKRLFPGRRRGCQRKRQLSG
jgi:integrase